jgi:hypothetical protein
VSFAMDKRHLNVLKYLLDFLIRKIHRLQIVRQPSKENLPLLFKGQIKDGHQIWKYGSMAYKPSVFSFYPFVLLLYELVLSFIGNKIKNQ